MLSLITVSAHGLTKAETSEVLTHLAFYAGWPNTMSASYRL
jgi:alkylhydroperoxidase/carboxymuconolactone decarboxylase family protein YurZ